MICHSARKSARKQKQSSRRGKASPGSSSTNSRTIKVMCNGLIGNCLLSNPLCASTCRYCTRLRSPTSFRHSGDQSCIWRMFHGWCQLVQKDFGFLISCFLPLQTLNSDIFLYAHLYLWLLYSGAFWSIELRQLVCNNHSVRVDLNWVLYYPPRPIPIRTSAGFRIGKELGN